MSANSQMSQETNYNDDLTYNQKLEVENEILKTQNEKLYKKTMNLRRKILRLKKELTKVNFGEETRVHVDDQGNSWEDVEDVLASINNTE